ncbi:MAG: methyltransferase domain-containing protein [Candidatus Saganbacteria bacterium]|nr:methyltransferase domain-containing protein [Candidatus Saganbacteria bacterium]
MYIRLPITRQDTQRARGLWESQKLKTKAYGFTEFVSWVRASRQPVLSERAGFFLTEFYLRGVPILTQQINSPHSAATNYSPIGITAESRFTPEGFIETYHHRLTGLETKEAERFLEEAPLSELELKHRFLEPLLYHTIPNFSDPDIVWVQKERNEYATIHSEIVTVLQGLGLTSNDTVLDPACGEGQLAIRIIKTLGATMHLLDIAPSNVNKTIENARANGITPEKLAVTEGPVQQIKPHRKYRFVVLSGLLNRSVIINEKDAKTIVQNVADNCLKENGFLIVTGHTPSLFCAHEFETMGFEVIQRINPSKNRALYVLRYKGNFRPLEQEIAHFRETAMRKAKLVEYGERVFVEMRKLTNGWIRFINGEGRAEHERVKQLHAQLLRRTSQSLDDFFSESIIAYFFTTTASLTKPELVVHLPGWTREMIFHYFMRQQA